MQSKRAGWLQSKIQRNQPQKLDWNVTDERILFEQVLIDIDPPILTVEIPYVQQQKGIADCGLFAVAFAVHLAFGDDVSRLTFDQFKIRQHLIKCFQKKEMQPFPLTCMGSPTQPKLLSFQGDRTFLQLSDAWNLWWHDWMRQVVGTGTTCMDCVGLKSPPPEQEQWNCSKCSV